jgi:hypothetical protein
MPSHDPITRNGVSHGGQEGTSAWPGPLRHFADRLEEVRSANILDMDQVGRVLVELAADEEFFSPLIAQLPSGSPGSRWLIRPGRGPRLVLVHRPEGVMGYTHSHRCWVGIAPVRRVETHQRWDEVRQAGGRAELRLAAGPSCGWRTSAPWSAATRPPWSRPGMCTTMAMSPARVPAPTR